jgi:mono/diheme cytochrome c family protein
VRAGIRYLIGAAVVTLVIVLAWQPSGRSEVVSRSTAPVDEPFASPTPVSLLSQTIPDTTPNAEQLRRGQYLVIASDCMSCHLRPGGEPLAGGLALQTPFGTIYSTNITGDRETGIGAWSSEQFYRALHDGIGVKGKNIYPAFPYPWFRRMSRADSDAILAYLKTTPAVKYRRPENRLRFPLNWRGTVKAWNILYLKATTFEPDTAQTPEWNRGAYLVNGPGHCSGCHTPKGVLGADIQSKAFAGGNLDNWVAPDLTPNTRSGLGRWDLDDIAEYLKAGRNQYAGAAGAMAEVVTYSTSLLTDSDRHAIAAYLHSLPATPERPTGAPKPDTLARGAAIFSDACASCHLENGVGQPRYFPPLPHNAMLQQSDATGLEHLVLTGGRVGSTASRPSPLTMPSFAWKLTDQEIADVSTYIRNSWGNQASVISASDVGHLRKKLGLDSNRPTANSGDWDEATTTINPEPVPPEPSHFPRQR